MATRDAALDGLRGLAAITVVTYHCFLVWPGFANVILGDPAGSGPAASALTRTPLYLLLAGPQCVTVFFVLSGYVLVLPFLRRRPLAAWLAYYPRRAVRLWLPALAAVVLALGWQLAVPRGNDRGASWWLLRHTERTGLRGAAHDALLLRGTDWVDSALWSLQWEAWFSILLPVFVLLAVLLPRRPLGKLAGCLGLGAVGLHLGNPALEMLPIFGLGAVLAACSGQVRVFLAARTGRQRGLLLAVSLLLLINQRLVGQSLATPRTVVTVLVLGSSVGALGVVALAVGPSPLRRLCSHASVQWLGSVSFSLYLVHEPLLVSVAYLLGGRPDPLVLTLAVVPCSLLLAGLFRAFVEVPSTELSKRVGLAVSRRLGRTAAQPVHVSA